jgi:hypothetical protein
MGLAQLLGLAFIIAGKTGTLTIKRFGQKGHTRLSNWVNVAANSIWSLDTGLWGSLVGQALMALAHRKRDGLEAMIYKLGTTTEGQLPPLGGRGAVSGMLANFKSVACILAPSTYTWAYAMGVSDFACP